jgi:hypothetical protein
MRSRLHRADAGYTLADQAAVLKMQPSVIAKIETGETPVPDGYVASLSYWLRLDVSAANELKKLAKNPKSAAIFPGMNREQTAVLMRRFSNIGNLGPGVVRGLDSYLKAITDVRLLHKRKNRRADRPASA